MSAAFPGREGALAAAVPARIAGPPPGAAMPWWPALSIGFLLLVSIVMHPLVITVLNAMLVATVLVVWHAVDGQIERPLVILVAPFVGILAIGLPGGVGADLYLLFKDAWYVVNPALTLAAGYLLFRCAPDASRGLRAFVAVGVLLSLLHLGVFVARWELLLDLRAAQIRSIMGWGLYAPALAFLILLTHRGRWREGLRVPPALAAACLLVCTASMVLTFSRAILLVSLIGIAAAAGWLARRELARIAIVVPLLVGALLLAQGVVELDPLAARTSFFGKLVRSVEELTVGDQESLQDIHDNWRGYETDRALSTYVEGGPHEWLFGRGFGAQVDIGLFMELGHADDGPMRLIPVLHNGYAYLLVKAGPFAILLFAGLLAWIYLLARRAGNDPRRTGERPLHRLLQATVLTIAATTWIVAGAFNRFDMLPFLLATGYLVAASTWKGPAGRRGSGAGRGPDGARAGSPAG